MSTNHPLPRGLVAIVLVSLAAGCSSLTIDSEWDRSVDFNAFHSEAWIPQDAGLPASQQLAKHLDIRLRRVVDDIMIEDKGFGRAPALPAAGLLPAYHIDTQKELRVDYAVYGSYYGRATCRAAASEGAASPRSASTQPARWVRTSSTGARRPSCGPPSSRVRPSP
jgi:hypothetical protein